jgi:GAF domain-containing protein
MTKQEKYEQLLPQVCSLIEGEHDEVAVMSNVVAALHEAMGFFWTGFYRVKDGELLVGPFQGPTACFHIAYGRGVCGTAWKTGLTQVVPDVELFPGHIACSALSRSEIVVPLTDNKGEIRAVLDIDSKEVGTFDSTDQQQLERLCAAVSRQVYK